MPERRSSAMVCMLLVIGACALYALNAGGMVFVDPDESRCAWIARTMLTSGDWLVPRRPLTNEPYFDKPILYFWMLAAAFRVFGQTETAGRLLAAVAGASVVGLTYGLGRTLLSGRAAWLAAGMLATSVVMVVAGRFVRMDMWLTAFITGAVFFWCRVHFARASRWNLLAGYACLAAAVLTKGLIGLLLPLGAIGAFLAVRRDWAAIRRSGLPAGLLLVVAMAAPWFAYMGARNPGYLTAFFWRHHVLRASTDLYGRTGMVLYPPAIALGGFVPWTAVLAAALIRRLPLRRNTDRPVSPGTQLCLWWAGFGVVPFVFSHTQLPVYVLPAFPALALISGEYLDRVLNRERTAEVWWILGTTLAVMAVSLLTLSLINRQLPDTRPWATLAERSAGLAVLIVLAAWLMTRRRANAAWSALVLGAGVLAADAAFLEGPALCRRSSTQRFAAVVAEKAPDADLLVIGPGDRYALSWYLARPLGVKFIEHAVDVVDFANHPRPAVFLLCGKAPLAIARDNYPGRLAVLLRSGDECLARIDPAGSALPDR